jgi:hypothetical protein
MPTSYGTKGSDQVKVPGTRSDLFPNAGQCKLCVALIDNARPAHQRESAIELNMNPARNLSIADSLTFCRSVASVRCGGRG